MEPENILLWMAVTMTTLGVTVPAASQWFRTSQTCYYLHNVTQSFDNANATCRSLQSRLVELETVSEFTLVTDYLSSVGEVWVNLKRTTTDPLSDWSNGAFINSSMWIPGEPNFSGSCVRLVKSYPGGPTFPRHYLADISCDNLYLAMCEKPYVPARMTSTRASDLRLAGSLCQLFQAYSRSLLRCAQICTAVTNCMVYGFDKRAEICSLYDFSGSCAQTSVLSSAITYYNVSRRCN